MADISQYLQDILDAVYGEQVRGSIHDAIEIINEVSEVVLSTGTAVTGPTSSSTGFYTDSLYLNTSTYELWKCVGTDSWTSLGVMKGDPGSPGDDGNRWYNGTAISGKSVNPTVFSGSGITDANANDMYMNTSEGAVYYCVTGGDASTATWSYLFTLAGGGSGADVLSDLNDVSITLPIANGQGLIYNTSTSKWENANIPSGGLTNAFDEVVVGATTIAASGGDTLTLSAGSNITLTPNAGSKSVEISASGGGHTMIDTVADIEALTDGDDDYVVNGYAIKQWSNVDAINLVVQLSEGDDGVGTWEDDDTWESGSRTGWIVHSLLKDVLSDNSVEVNPVFIVPNGTSNAVSAYSMRVDDGITGSLGGVAIKLNAPIDVQTAYVGVQIKRYRVATVTVSPYSP